jgi:L-lactate dehydrogenase complex protein LldG
MTSSRDLVLGRIRSAVAADDRAPVAVDRAYDRQGKLAPGSAEVVELFIDRLIDYRALVRRANPDSLETVIDEALDTVGSVVVPPGLPPAVLQACGLGGRAVTVDSGPGVLTPAELDRIDVVVTGARVAIAVSGTIILDGEADQGRRAISLVPDRHLVILHAGQVVETVAEAIALLEPTRPLTMISGPSATSDIELERVEGVHGPRTLEVIIVEDIGGTVAH